MQASDTALNCKSPDETLGVDNQKREARPDSVFGVLPKTKRGQTNGRRSHVANAGDKAGEKKGLASWFVVRRGWPRCVEPEKNLRKSKRIVQNLGRRETFQKSGEMDPEARLQGTRNSIKMHSIQKKKEKISKWSD